MTFGLPVTGRVKLPHDEHGMAGIAFDQFGWNGHPLRRQTR